MKNSKIQKSLNSFQWILIFLFIFRKRIPNFLDLKVLMHIRYGRKSESVNFTIPANSPNQISKNPFKRKIFWKFWLKMFRMNSFGMNERTIFFGKQLSLFWILVHIFVGFHLILTFLSRIKMLSKKNYVWIPHQKQPKMCNNLIVLLSKTT